MALHSMTQHTIRTIEELSFRALPAIEQRYYDGWLLRCAGSYSRRANSVNPVYGSTLDTESKIDFCEAFYFERRRDIHFKMTEAACPPNLDGILNTRGYMKVASTSIQIAELASLDLSMNELVEIRQRLTPEWLNHYARLNHLDPQHIPTLQHILPRIVPETCYMSLKQNGETVAVGLGVRDGDYIGLFDVVIAPEQRRRGYGDTLVRSLLKWGRDCGARYAYLQVVADNVPAVQLYAKIGFHEVYQYWYRTKKAEPVDWQVKKICV